MKKILFLLFLVGACHVQSGDDYGYRLSKWVGQRESLLAQKWGQPEQMFRINEDTMAWVYVKESKHGYKDPYRSMFYYPAMSGPQYGQSQIPTRYYCQTTFSVRNGIVTNYSFIGDDCI